MTNCLVYIQLPATISQLKEATKSELPKDKSKEKLDFFIWRGQLLGMSSMIPEDSRLDEPIISLGLIEKGPLHLPHTAKPPSISSYQSVDQDTQLARLCCGTLFDIARTVEYLTQIESAADFAAIQVGGQFHCFRICASFQGRQSARSCTCSTKSPAREPPPKSQQLITNSRHSLWFKYLHSICSATYWRGQKTA